MDAKLVHQRAVKMARAVGPRAEIYISMSSRGWYGGEPLHATIYPRGMGQNAALTVDAATFEAMFETLETEWAKHADKSRRDTVRAMALEIIRLTAEGNCTDSALRGDKFTAEEVAEFGAEACEDANQIASNGPFSIAAVKNANAA